MKQIIALLLILFLVGCTTDTIVVDSTNDTIPADTTTDDTTLDDTTDTTDDTVDDTTTDDTTDDTNTTDTTDDTTLETAHTVEVQDDGFEPDELTIAVGDTVVFKNIRDDKFTQAYIIGAQGVCKSMSSKEAFPPKGFFDPGEEFSYTFEEAGECTYVDAVLTTILGRITIE